MTADRLTMLANPARDQEAQSFRDAIRAAGADIDELSADDPSEIGDAVRAAIADGATVVAAVGGDGTQRTVGAALAGTQARLGVVPGGTVNLLAQVLGIDSAEAAARAVLSGSGRAIDLGSCNGERFVLNSSSGYDADVIARADSGNKERWGRLSFVAAAITALRAARRVGVTVTVDGTRVFAGQALSIIVTNVAERSSADFEVAPEADFDDGVLDVMIVRVDTARGVARLLWALARGRSPHTGDLLRQQGADIDISWARPVMSQIDGDVAEEADRFVIDVEPAALNICV